MLGFKKIFMKYLLILLVIELLAGCAVFKSRHDQWQQPLRYRICLNGNAEVTDVSTGRTSRSKIPYSYSQKKKISFQLQLPEIKKILEKHRVILEFESIAGDVELFINGQEIKSFRSSSFEKQEIEITDAIKTGDRNLLKIITDVPKKSKTPFISRGFRWGNYQYGIIGNVFLRLEPYILTEELKIETSVREKRIKVIGWLSNNTKSLCEVSWTPKVTLNGNSKLLLPTKKIKLPAGKVIKVTSEAEWKNPELWGYGQYGKPVLYTLETTISTDNQVCDIRYDRFGFREIWAEKNKILFNNQPVFFRFGLLGPMYGSHREYFSTLFKAYRAINFDCLRYSLENHNNSQGMFNLADETGFLLKPMFYLGHGKVFHHTHQLTEAEKQELTRLYRKTIRNYWNHPSMMWIYVDNEFSSGGAENRLKLRELAMACKQEDTTRILDHGGDPSLMLMKNNGKYPELEIWSIRSGGKDYLKGINKMIKDYNYKGDIPLVNDEIYAGGFLFDDGTSIPFFLKNPDIVAAHTSKLGDFYAKNIKGLYELGFQSVGPCYGGGPFFTYIHPGKPIKFPFEIKNSKSRLKIRWPSSSGEDGQCRQKSMSTNHGFYNWFDTTRPEFYTSVMAEKIAETVKELGFKTPPLTMASPEVIAAVYDKDGKPQVNSIVLLQEQGKRFARGMRADNSGTAWFVLDFSGEYRASVLNSDISTKIIDVKDQAKQGPGYAHIQWLALGDAQDFIDKRVEQLKQPAEIIRKKVKESESAGPYIGPRNLVAHWVGDESADNPLSLKAMQAKGGKLITEKGKKYLIFDGKREVVIPYPVSLDKSHTGLLTLAAWINPEEYDCGIILKRDHGAMPNYCLKLQEDGTLFFGGRFGATFSGTPGIRHKIKKNRWTHVCVTVDGKEVKLYVNGKLDIAHPKPGKLRNNKDILVIGKSLPQNRSKRFVGKISDIKIFNYPLSSAEVRDLHMQSNETSWGK
jgi:concanavalin A-like lectin/glucanase superfamily protein/glycosyl hydrolase family 2